MKNFIFLPLLLSLSINVVAQNWVEIPDANFANKLNEQFPECMDGNLMNTECAGVVNTTSLNVFNDQISTLSGLEYFVSLESLNCGHNNLTSLPELPQSLIVLRCHENNLTILPELPESLTVLDCRNNNLTTLPELPASLFEMKCRNNNLTTLPELPTSLALLFCSSNNLISMPSLPEALTTLSCYNNNLTTLPELPEFLEILICAQNQLSSLPTLPESLIELECRVNNLSHLPDLPNSLTHLYCNSNNLTHLPILPPGLTTLSCSANQINCLPTLPMSLDGVGASSTYYFSIGGNPFTCVPNYVPAMNGYFNSYWLTYPLCNITDLENNPFGCSSLAGIAGTIFKDGNTNCEADEGEGGLLNIPLKLLDDNGNLVATTISFTNLAYNFMATEGAYTVQLDTENKPYYASCDDPGTSQDVLLTEFEQSALDVDFGVECPPGVDIGVQSVVTTGWIFPGQVHKLKITAGDMANWYGVQCTQGLSGTVTVDIDGPVSYVGPAEGAMTPTASGNLQFTYNIIDFADVNFQQDFALMLETDTTAQADDRICVLVTVTPLNGDLNPENNSYHHCYEVVNSYDPNIKQVWPHNVEPGYDDYFNYTIYFQNTGTAPAFKIRLADTLDTNLDLNTFEVTAYSHACLTYVSGNVATFRFNNIMLPDSTSDFEGSIGYVQYRIKPIADLPVGTVIENTAHIYFDFNEAIVTNTTQNVFEIITSITEQPRQQVQVFPNPGTGLYNVSLHSAATGISTMEVFSISGVRVAQQTLSSRQTVLDLTHQPPGMYLLRVQNELGSEVVKMVKH